METLASQRGEHCQQCAFILYLRHLTYHHYFTIGQTEAQRGGIVPLASHSQVMNGRAGTRTSPLKLLPRKMLVGKAGLAVSRAGALDRALGRESGSRSLGPLTQCCDLGKSPCFSGP